MGIIDLAEAILIGIVEALRASEMGDRYSELRCLTKRVFLGGGGALSAP